MQGRVGRGNFRREFGLSADVVYQFGLANSREIEEWAPGLTFLDDWTYYDDGDPKLGMARWFAGWSFSAGRNGRYTIALARVWGRTGDQPAGGLTNRSI